MLYFFDCLQMVLGLDCIYHLLIQTATKQNAPLVRASGFITLFCTLHRMPAIVLILCYVNVLFLLSFNNHLTHKRLSFFCIPIVFRYHLFPSLLPIAVFPVLYQIDIVGARSSSRFVSDINCHMGVP